MASWKQAVGVLAGGLSVMALLAVLNRLTGLRPIWTEQQAGQVDLDPAPAPVPPADTSLRLKPTRGLLQREVSPENAGVFLEIWTAPQDPRFEPDRLTVPAGQVVSLTFRNTSQLDHPHSFTLVRPGTEREVARAAERAGPLQGYDPNLPDTILATTGILPPGESDTIVFRAPSEPGRYPFICTFPGHWRAMHGTLEVTR